MMTPSLQTTALHSLHIEHHAKMVEFAGFDMPIHYGSQLEEHLAVRKSVGLFDVSHMVITDLSGPETQKFLSYLLANDVNKLKPNQALYSCMLNPDGGIIDDLIVYYLGDHQYRLVTNAGTREKDLNWIRTQAEPYDLSIQIRSDLSILALQGPEYLTALSKLFNFLEASDPHQKSLGKILEQLKTLPNFYAFYADHEENLNWFVTKTGYTGEIGIEILLPHAEAVWLFQHIQPHVQLCGLGARDTLRLEAGMNLYGLDMDETVSPLECGLAWTVSLNTSRNFIGKSALENQKQQGIQKKQVGLLLTEKGGVLRSHQKIYASPDANDPIGETTSGSFAPSLETSIAFGRISSRAQQDELWVEIRHKKLKARVVKLPFVKYGQILI